MAIIAGAIPFKDEKEKDKLVKEIKEEFKYAVSITINRLENLITYHSMTSKSVLDMSC